jgi:hypothetical protein
MLSARLCTLSIPSHRRRKVLTRVQKNDDAWDPDEQRRINDNKQWRADQPEEDVWDIDKERDAVRYKRESLESIFRIGQKEAMDKMKEQIEEWESVNSSNDD